MINKKKQNESITMPEQELRLVFAPKTEEQEIVSLLSALCASSKKKVCSDYIKKYLIDNHCELTSFLSLDLPKVRKNAARLIGTVGTEKDIPYLVTALNREDQLFVIPSMILAIGNIGGDRGRKALEEYRIPTNGEDRNILDIKEALIKAQNKTEETDRITITCLDKEYDVLIIPPEGFVDVLSDEMNEQGIAHTINKTGCITHTSDISKLYRLRCAQEILIPLGKAQNVSEIGNVFKDYSGIPYRIELKEVKDNRNELIKSIAASIGGKNNPSSYQNEFRIVFKGKQFYCYLNPYNVEDFRYTYRKRTIPASIHPATAAGMVRYAKSLFDIKDNAVVLDPCCGSGTILFEREKLGRCKSLLGCDISNHAIDAAKENKKAGNSIVQFIAKDLRKFNIRKKADEIYANLPFGNRVGTHSENEVLYEELLNKINSWMAEDGFAILYTMEFHLLGKLLKKHKNLELIKQIQTEAGGLLPHIFAIKKKG